MALLAAVATNFRYGHAIDADAQKRVLYLVQLMGLNNRFDLLHCGDPFPSVFG